MDPLFLRNVLSNSVYAEQINSAQIQGQQASKDRATRLRQETLKDEQTTISSLEEAMKTDVKERDERRHDAEQELLEERERNAEDQDGLEGEVSASPFRHIDLTV
jgi:Flp pilus assembly protein TadB